MRKIFIISVLLLFVPVLFSNAQTLNVPCDADALIEINDGCPSWQTSNYGTSSYLWAITWTWYGSGCAQGNGRSLLHFDLNIVHNPQQLYDNRATLYLYYPTGSVETHWYTGSATDNQFYVQRVIAAWSEMIITWDNQPLTTNIGQITVPSCVPNPSSQDYQVDISTLVLDWICNSVPNFGMELRQVNEGQTYRRVTFTSREYAVDTLRRPTLTLEYAQIAASATDTICDGTNFSINCSLTNASNPAGYQFVWSHLNTGTNYNTQNVSNPAQVPGLNTYVVTVSNPWCQTATDTVDVFVTQQPNAVATYNSPLCEGDSLQLTASGANTYQWTGPNGFSSSQQNPVIPNADPSDNGVYTLIVSNGFGCDSTATVNVIIFANPVVVISGNTEVCQNSLVQLTASGASSYSWSTGGSSATELVMPIDTTTYYVTGTNPNGCSDSAQFTIATWHRPVPDITITSETCTGISNGWAKVIASDGQPPYTFAWSTGQSGDSATGIGAGNYSVTVTDSNGCTNTQSELVAGSAEPCYTPHLYIPNTFSPNGDGLNDVLYVRGAGVESLIFFIFDRWGQKIFESKSLDVGWDGTKNEKKFDPAVFVYYIKATYLDGTNVVMKGNVTLVR